MGWLAAATTASAWTRIISMPLQPRHSPFSPQWHSCGRRRSSAACTSDMSAGPAMATNLRRAIRGGDRCPPRGPTPLHNHVGRRLERDTFEGRPDEIRPKAPHGTYQKEGSSPLRRLLPLVHRLDLLLVVLLDDLPPDVQLERKLALRLREVAGQKLEILDGLPVAAARVGAIDHLLDVPPQRVLVETFLTGGVPVGHDQRGDIRLALADDDGALDEVVAHEVELERLRRHVLADRRFEEPLLARGDLQKAVGLHLPPVP